MLSIYFYLCYIGDILDCDLAILSWLIGYFYSSAAILEDFKISGEWFNCLFPFYEGYDFYEPLELYCKLP